MYPGITPEFEKDLDALLNWLVQEVKKTDLSKSSLPWFQHGIRGFFRKLWHGDHPTNPDWYSPEEGVTRRPTLQEYIEYQKEVERELDSFFEAVPGHVDAVLGKIVQEFKKQFLVLMSHYIVGGTTTGGDENRIAQAVAKELPQAIMILKNAGMDREAIIALEPSKLAQQLLQHGIDSLPHIRRAARNPEYHEELKRQIMHVIGATSD